MYLLIIILVRLLSTGKQVPLLITQLGIVFETDLTASQHADGARWLIHLMTKMV